MNIRVTLIFLLCICFAANTKNKIKAQRMSSNSKFPDRRDLMKRSEPKHRVYEYSRSMEAINIDFRNENDGRQVQITKPVTDSEIVVTEDLQNDLSRSLSEDPSRSLQELATIRINSKQPSQIFGVGFVPLGEKVLSRKKKDGMQQAVLPLLMAYKMKFTALVPILFGGLSLLVSTTALAGFFFALFAAVLGLKSH